MARNKGAYRPATDLIEATYSYTRPAEPSRQEP